MNDQLFPKLFGKIIVRGNDAKIGARIHPPFQLHFAQRQIRSCGKETIDRHLSFSTMFIPQTQHLRFNPSQKAGFVNADGRRTLSQNDDIRDYLSSGVSFECITWQPHCREQFGLLLQNHHMALEVGTSTQPIPVHFSFAEHDHIEGSMSAERRLMMRDLFDLPDLAAMDDGIANGTHQGRRGEPEPLALFTAPRVDYSLHRLRHLEAGPSSGAW